MSRTFSAFISPGMAEQVFRALHALRQFVQQFPGARRACLLSATHGPHQSYTGDLTLSPRRGRAAGDSVRAMIEANGATLRVPPPCSPDLNPIEMALSRLRALLRDAAERPFEGLWNTIGRIVGIFTPGACANRFAAAGYEGN